MLKKIHELFLNLNFDKYKIEKIWKFQCFLDLFYNTLLLYKKLSMK
jgi:hypothetical protein